LNLSTGGLQAEETGRSESFDTNNCPAASGLRPADGYLEYLPQRWQPWHDPLMLLVVLSASTTFWQS